MKVLRLTLKKKWFDMILSGEKKEEYRDIKEYWYSRLMHYDIAERNNYFSYKQYTEFKIFDAIEFINGYATNSPRFTIECLGIEIGEGKPELGAELGVKYFVIKLGEIINA